MIPKAIISHRLRNRLRIHVRGRSRSGPRLRRIESTLQKCEGVDAVHSNPKTGSILIHHHADLETLKAYARRENLFQLVDARSDQGGNFAPFRKRLSTRLEDIDHRVTESTHGQMDLTAMSVVTLMGLSVFQATQGKLLPPAWTLLQSALEKLRDLSGE